jgi:hypothetical protein
LRKANLAGVAVILLVGMAAAAPNISIEFRNGTFLVSGWQAPASAPAQGWGSALLVYAGAGNVPPLLGHYAVESGSLVFHPEYPIAPGVHYRVVFRPPTGGAPIEKDFDGPPRPSNPEARVEQIYPSGDVWPSNQLRMYIYFSAPMSRGEAASYVHVFDREGHDLGGPRGVFLPGEELWDPGFRRLTMTFDPGRIKRGLTSNQSMGPPITEGKTYTVVIDRQWPDARGVPLLAEFRRTFRGGPAERTPPDPKQWRMTAPKAGTRDALVVDFPTPMNYPLLLRMLQVKDLRGTVSIAHEEWQWRFTPSQPWPSGAHQLVVDTGLEDLAGNHIGQPFDLDVFNRVTEHIDTKTVSLPFTIH